MFIDAVRDVNAGKKDVSDFDHATLASLVSTYRTTAILEAGRVSLDQNCSVRIVYADPAQPCEPTSLEPCAK